jgi:N-acetylneuraminate synthase
MISRTLIIAEAGVNHDGDIGKALALVDAAADAGADIVKFQTFSADQLAARYATKAAYQKTTTDASESQHAMLKRLELDVAAHRKLIAHARSRRIDFLSTPFDLESLELLAGKLKLKRLKLGSGELTNAPLLVAAGKTGLPIFLSTGMGTLGETERALGWIGVGMLGLRPGYASLAKALYSPKAHALRKKRITLLHCTTQYPAPPSDVNLRAMDTLRAAFDLPVGYSDHSLGVAVSVAAVARGARVIEKHFTLNKRAPGPDHAASLEPTELDEMVKMIRVVEEALGDGAKLPRPSEIPNIAIARKSVVAAKAIGKGERFTVGNLAVKRPGDGLAPELFFELVGRVATRDFAADEKISA